MNFNRGCDTGSPYDAATGEGSGSTMWIGNGVWKNGVKESCTPGTDQGCCSSAEIAELLNPPASSGTQVDALCPQAAANLTDCKAKAGGAEAPQHLSATRALSLPVPGH